MNNTTRVIALVVLLLFVGGGVYLFARSHKASQTAENTIPQKQTQQMTTGKKSLFDFFSISASEKCTYTDKATNGSGTVYVSGGKMRGDFQTTQNLTHMINDGKYVYIWTEGQKTGYKMSMDLVKKEIAQATSSLQNSSGSSEERPPSQVANMNRQADYSCGAWSADASKFAVPSDITFADYSAMMQGVMTGTPKQNTMQGNPAACAQCNQVPAGAARNQCLTALKCQ